MIILISAGSTGCDQVHNSSGPTPHVNGSAPSTTRGSAAKGSSSTDVPTTRSQPTGPPYPITEMTMHLVDPSRPTVSHAQTISSSRALTTQVWLPERTGRSPLIVFAHGFEVGPAPYAALLESWAAHGYVVAAPEFPLTDSSVAGPNLDEADINNQPEDVRFVTDYLVSPQSPIVNRIDPTKVAVAGHSDGAETVLAASVDPAPAGGPTYRAVLAFGAQPVPEAEGHNPPILVEQGDEDEINPPSKGYATFAEAISPKYLMVAKGGGHLPPLEAGSPWLPGIEAVSEAFLDAYVAGDAPPGAIASAADGYQNVSLTAG
jgi:dienelactone hydrolase